MRIITTSLRSILILALLCTASLSRAQDAEYRSALHDFMKASGTMQIFSAALDQMVEMQKSTHAEIDPAVWEELRRDMELSLDDLIEMLAPIYARHFSIDDLRDVTAFYRTPVGRKLTQETPALMQESMQAGAAWGQEIGARLARKIEERSK